MNTLIKNSLCFRKTTFLFDQMYSSFFYLATKDMNILNSFSFT